MWQGKTYNFSKARHFSLEEENISFHRTSKLERSLVIHMFDF